MTSYLEALPFEPFSLVLSFLSPIVGSGDNDDLHVAAACKGLRDQVEDIAKGSVKQKAAGAARAEDALVNLQTHMAAVTQHTRMPYRLLLRSLKNNPLSSSTIPGSHATTIACGLPDGSVALLST